MSKNLLVKVEGCKDEELSFRTYACDLAIDLKLHLSSAQTYKLKVNLGGSLSEANGIRGNRVTKVIGAMLDGYTGRAQIRLRETRGVYE